MMINFRIRGVITLLYSGIWWWMWRDLQRFRGRGEQSHWAGPVGAVVKKSEVFTSKQSSEKEENQTGYIIKENFAKS